MGIYNGVVRGGYGYIYIYMYMYMYMYMYIYTCIYTYTCVYIVCGWVGVRACVGVCMRVCVCLCLSYTITYIRVCVCVCVSYTITYILVFICFNFSSEPVRLHIALALCARSDVLEGAKVGVHIHHLDCSLERQGIGPVRPDVRPRRKVTL